MAKESWSLATSITALCSFSSISIDKTLAGERELETNCFGSFDQGIISIFSPNNS